MTMADIEREAIVLALRESEGNRRKAAERLGIGERTLYRKLKEYGIEVLHLTSCLVQVCPFKEEFVKTIKKEYPDIEVVEGTHPFHDLDAFKAGIKELTAQRAVTPQKMNDIVFKRIKIHFEDDAAEN